MIAWSVYMRQEGRTIGDCIHTLLHGNAVMTLVRAQMRESRCGKCWIELTCPTPQHSPEVWVFHCLEKKFIVASFLVRWCWVLAVTWWPRWAFLLMTQMAEGWICWRTGEISTSRNIPWWPWVNFVLYLPNSLYLSIFRRLTCHLGGPGL